MAITPKSGFGTLVKIGDGASSETFNEVEGVKSITGPENGLETFDATHHSSGGGYREVVATFKTGGTCTFNLIFDSTNTYHQQLITDYEARTLRNFQIAFSDAGSHLNQFAAFITSMSTSAPLDDALMMNVTLTISGAITRT